MIRTLRELGFGYRKITAKFSDENRKICTIQSICRETNERGSAVVEQPGTVCTEENVVHAAELTYPQRNLGRVIRLCGSDCRNCQREIGVFDLVSV